MVKRETPAVISISSFVTWYECNSFNQACERRTDGGLKVLKTIFFHLVIDISEDDNSEINIWEASEKHEGPVFSAMDLRLNVNLALLIELIT